jgi:hypothetical protein
VTVSTPPFYPSPIDPHSSARGMIDRVSLGLISLSTHPPRVFGRQVIQTAQRLIWPLLMRYAPLLNVPAAVVRADRSVHSGPLRDFLPSRHFLSRAKMRYITAMTARYLRWLPLIYNEHGEELLLAKNPADALPSFTAALCAAEDDLRNLSDAFQVFVVIRSFREVRRQNTCQYLLNRAEALKGIGDYPASIADLTALIKSYGTEKIVIPIDVEGSFSVSNLVVATQRRAITFELNKQLPPAIADYTALLAVKPEDNLDGLMTIWDTVRRRVGAASTFAIVPVTARLKWTPSAFGFLTRTSRCSMQGWRRLSSGPTTAGDSTHLAGRTTPRPLPTRRRH